MTFLRLDRIDFAYPGQPPIVRGIDLALPAGAIHCLVGRSGCGKTTLLKLAAGLLQPTAGRVSWLGRPSIDRRQVGFVFQSPTLLEWLDVSANVLLPVSLQRRPTGEDARAADALLARLGLAGLGHRHPRQLSGGQQSRVALARALLLHPPLLLLDEPFAALDAITREELQQDLLKVCREQGTTALFVTHDLAEAVYLGDRVSVLADGRLVRTIDPALPPRRTPQVRSTPAFAAACERAREALGLLEVPA